MFSVYNLLMSVHNHLMCILLHIATQTAYTVLAEMTVILIWWFGESLHDCIIVYASMGFFLYSNQNCQFKIPPTAFSEQTAKYNFCKHFCLYGTFLPPQ